VPLKQMAMARAEENCLIADATKLDQIKPACFAEIPAFDRIVTDASIAPEIRRRFTDAHPVFEVAAL